MLQSKTVQVGQSFLYNRPDHARLIGVYRYTRGFDRLCPGLIHLAKQLRLKYLG